MLQRTSCVDHIHIDIVSFASTIQLGDAKIVNSQSRAMAVQREAEVFFSREGNYSNYSNFTEPIPFVPITEEFSYASFQLNPIIKVNRIAILGVSSASILQVGNSEHVSLEARIKHIRQLLPEGEEPSQL